MRVPCHVPVIVAAVILGFYGPSPVLGEEPVSFTRDIRPLLSDRCFKCHGPDQKKQKADLRLDTKEGALAPLDDEGKVFTVVPGDLDKSELYYRITTDDEDDLMPPPDEAGLALSDAEKNLIKRWIEEGAEFEDLWSFVTPESPTRPGVSNAEWTRNAIDEFVLARLEAEGLSPSPEANKRTLIRRVSFDITGLPPTPQEVDAFVNDSSPKAYENLVDRLLKSKRYGERMAVEWLDAARYADTSGYQYDWPRTMWRWRDWVIGAYNDNLSYDQFITWQIAGDLLPDATLDQKIATGFNRNHPFTIEGGTIDEEYRVSYVSDRVTTMGTVFLGMTFECTRCHDHKYDPVSQKDFYQLYAFFNNVKEKGRIGGKPASAPPSIAAPSAEQETRLSEIEADLTTLRDSLERPNPALDAKQAEWEKAIPESAWKIIRPDKFTSAGGAELELLKDSSVLATGKNPGKEIYEITAMIREAQLITGFRIEALTHPGMTKGGPGRHPNGNAVLTNVEIAVDGEILPVARASADYEQPNYPIAHAIDDNPQSGWAFYQKHVDHAAVFQLAAAHRAEPGSDLRVTLRYESIYGGSNFGRVRYALTSSPEPALGDSNGRLREIAAKTPAERSKEEAEQIRRAFRAANDPEWRNTQSELVRLEREKETITRSIPQTMIMDDAQPRETFILDRGTYDQPLDKVEADTPAQLPAFPEGAPRNRLGLAQWLTTKENPLTARVTMNRIWHQVFGTGIVKTVNDFGSQAELPTHPELLDWLAVEFVESGWDLKAMIKTIVTSATYRQSSNTSKELEKRDPENRFLARGPRHRLSAEMLRDNALFAGDLLIEKIGGPSVKPYQPPGLWKEMTLRPGYMQIYEADKGDGLHRRSLYTFWKRAAHHPMMSTFDAPNREVCTFNRGITNTPLQALTLLHDPQFVESGRGLAQRVLTEKAAGSSVESRIGYAFRIATARLPEPDELKALAELFESEKKALSASPGDAEKLLAVGESAVPENLDPVELGAWMMVSRAILNLSETVSKN